jgi:ribosomal-protein-alanine N-acetyltransferase
VFEIYPAYYQQTGYEPPFMAYLIQENETIVGICSFTQPPKEGRVEISYWTFQQYEGRGIASTACAYLIGIAQSTRPDLEIFAKTLPEHNASTKILERNGFHQTGIVHDEDVGDAWEWTYRAAQR